MTNFFQNLQRLILSAWRFLDNQCKPNPKYAPRHSEQELALQRNRGILALYACLIVSFALDIIKGGPLVQNLIRIVFAIICVSYLFFSQRYHPQIFKIYYSSVAFTYGPSAIYTDTNGIYIGFIVALIIPLCVQLVTGDFKHFIIQVIVNSLLVNTFYQEPMKKTIESSSPEDVLKGFTYACNMCLVIQTLFLGLMGRFIDQAHQRALNFEQKQSEAEKQKVFLLGFSHELRNLINSLTGNVKLASLEKLSDEAHKFLQNAEICGELLLHMINNILDTGKSQIGELEVNPIPTQTYDTFEKTWQICSELIKRKGLHGCMKIPKDIPRMLLIDQHRITQIFLNLVGNAIKFTERGSINIKVEWLSHRQGVREECFQPYPFNYDEYDEGLFEKQQDFSTLGDDNFVLTTNLQKVNRALLRPASHCRRGVLKMIVSDTGCGMDKPQTEKLFQKFMQVTPDEAKRKLGTGLGLYISKQLCDKMKVEIRVYSRKDTGSSFIFCLPAETTDDRYQLQTYEDMEAIRKLLAEQNLKMMIVDDALPNQVILRNFFEKLGIDVADIAVNGFEAYQKYVSNLSRGNPFQIISMDLDMPIMNGKEASQKIRELEAIKGLKPCFLLIISGNCVESEVLECLNKEGRIRANAFLRKPIKMEELVRVVAAHFLNTRTIGRNL